MRWTALAQHNIRHQAADVLPPVLQAQFALQWICAGGRLPAHASSGSFGRLNKLFRLLWQAEQAVPAAVAPAAGRPSKILSGLCRQYNQAAGSVFYHQITPACLLPDQQPAGCGSASCRCSASVSCVASAIQYHRGWTGSMCRSLES